jgi:hypothetical protein
MKTAILNLLVCAVLLAVSPLADAQAPVSTPVEKSSQAPQLSPEQRRKFAEVRDSLNKDPEYSSAVKKVQDAHKAADKLFFAKLRKAAPDLGEYIRYLENARGLIKPAQP